MEEEVKMERKKKKYTKPQVKRVELIPEEAVLSGCKSDTSNFGAFSNKCARGKKMYVQP